MTEFKAYIDRSNMGVSVLRDKKTDDVLVLGGNGAEETFQELLSSAGENEDHRPDIFVKEGTDYLAIMADEMGKDEAGSPVLDAASMSWCIGVGYDGI